MHCSPWLPHQRCCVIAALRKTTVKVMDPTLATQLSCVVMKWIHKTGIHPPNITINCESLSNWYNQNSDIATIRDEIISSNERLECAMNYENFAVKACIATGSISSPR